MVGILGVFAIYALQWIQNSIISHKGGNMTIFVLLLNVVALLVVAYQTYLTRESLNMDRKVRQLEVLPDANHIISVIVVIKRWKTKCDELAQLLKEAIKTKDIKLIHKISKQGKKSPMGLVEKGIYEFAPKWLVNILMSSAQHYYNSVCLMSSIWDEKKQEPNSFMLNKNLVVRCKESSQYLSELLNYIKDIIPESYLKTPASINDKRFLSE
ncbi:hypothetical protein KAU39_01850 [bacterium]|nr:hypothetical protein [bacterium]